MILTESQETSLLPDRRTNQKFFMADILDFAAKGDGISMELPIFSLATQPDLNIFKWLSTDNKRSVEVIPSAKGRATMFDKDVLIYIISQITEGINRGREDSRSRTVRFKMSDYLRAVGRKTSGKEYLAAESALDRLAGTRIKTNIATGNKVIKKNFGLIEQWTIVEKSADDDKVIGIEVTISEWLFNSIQAKQVLTVNKKYFQLRRPMERRVYELARKHCGTQTKFIIGLDVLKSKVNPGSRLNEFKSQIMKIIDAKIIPDYFLKYDPITNQVIFHFMKSKAWKMSEGYGLSCDSDFHNDAKFDEYPELDVVLTDEEKHLRFLEFHRLMALRGKSKKLSKKELLARALRKKRAKRSEFDIIHYDNNSELELISNDKSSS